METTGAVRVVPTVRWPSGDSVPLAWLTLTAADFAERYGEVFGRTYDEQLGAASLLALCYDLEEIWFLDYDDSPEPGLAVYVDALADKPALWEILKQSLALTPADYSWVVDFQH